MSGLETGLLAAAVLLGALTQRATGLGFALVAAPFLVLVTGPAVGVSLSNALSASLCALVLARTWRRALWREVALLAVPALLVIPLGVLVVRTLPDGPLLVAVGTLSIAAVLVVAVGRRRELLPGRRSALLAGALSGFMNVTAGVGGPMVSAYAVSRRWPLPVFIPTAQATLLTVNVASLLGKGVPSLGAAVWAVSGCALVAGLVAGEAVSRRLDAARGLRLVIAVALAGGVAAVVRGLAEL
ncbi:sulfite exporter TauE/SafE family protein [Geodermatophilus sp. YIM 151500]|uniref:sulfite exporter TauE/SafE family protein n=1 Tax=Geodermatophilus sp. YIM 151500 TaxID=2984531 RepID=UPI0021E49C31|nr:sulfite exporter TauE/SafE family protein [Geodermatophilus sp. YIM 151500]MCV2491707.1 sulfite exporter TauE/SafE family protein [Geodermatophilus sp. YIM 151500]